MKIKEGFMLREVAGSYVVVAVGQASKQFKGVINLNATGAFLFGELIKGCTTDELINKMLNEYEVSKEICTRDCNAFIETLSKNNLLE